MKKFYWFIIICSSISFSQSWNEIETDINIEYPYKLEIFTNLYGNHILVQNIFGEITYYKVNLSGEIENMITLTNAGSFPKITGLNENVYILFKESNSIKCKYSLDGGINWLNAPSLSTSENLCNGLDAVYQDNVGLHIVWATRDDHPKFKTYYYLLTLGVPPVWTDFQNITDQIILFGGNPSVAVSENIIHVSYNTNSYGYPTVGDVNLREKVNGQWQNTQTVIGNNNIRSVDEKLLVKGDSLFLFFASFELVDEEYPNFLCYKKKQINNLNWSSKIVVKEFIQLYGNAFCITKTKNNLIHTAYAPETVDDNNGLGHKLYNGFIWSNPTIINFRLDQAVKRGMSFSSNDVFVISASLVTDNLILSQYDAAPLAPANYSVSAYQSGTNYYPRLTWSLNNEPDVRQKTSNAYKIERRTRPLNGTWSSWSVLANLSGTTSSYIDYSINNASGGDREAEYRITAIDEGNNPSPVQSVTIVYGQGILDKIKSNEMISDYSLEQNYPNPFNPTTKISYSIKEEGLVTLTVYDVLGKEIASLVNENQPAGNYEVDFNASQLPSGVYIYTLQVNGFTSSKKMLLMK